MIVLLTVYVYQLFVNQLGRRRVSAAALARQRIADDDSSDGASTAATEHGNKRATLCVSSQVGCAMGCTFCATGTMGLLADLTSAEIVEQLVHARAQTPIRNVVFMVRIGFYGFMAIWVSTSLH